MRVLQCIALFVPFTAEAIRLTEESYTTNSTESREGQCTTKQITDATICGVSQITQAITDVLACPPKKECRKVWGRKICVDVPQICEQVLDAAKTCDVLDTCPVALSATLAGTGTISNLLEIDIQADVVKVEVESGHDMVKNLVNANLNLVMPALNTIADLGLMEVNKEIKMSVGSLRTKVLTQMEQHNIGRFFTVLNNVEANKALVRILNKTWDTFQANIAPRKQLEKASRLLSRRKRLCHRNLRIRVEDGPTYLVENWTDAVIARKFDEETDCDTVYSAQCERGIVIKRKQCPFKEDVVQRKCLFGIGCWRRKYTIKSSPTKTTSIDGSDMEVDTRVWIDHVKGKKRGTARMLTDSETEEPADLDDQIDLKIPGFQKMVVDDMCSSAGDGAWFPFAGRFRRWRCTGIVNTVCNLARWSGKLSFSGMPEMNIKFSLKDDFEVSVIPDWDSLEEMVATSLMTQLSKKELPMNARVTEIVLDIDGQGSNLEVTPNSKIYLTADINMGGKIPAVGM